MGGQLASFASLAEEQEVFAATGANGRWTTIGVNDIATEGVWVNEDGTPMAYTNWKRGEPNNWGGREDCIYVRGGQWQDVPCTGSYPFICKKPGE